MTRSRSSVQIYTTPEQKRLFSFIETTHRIQLSSFRGSELPMPRAKRPTKAKGLQSRQAACADYACPNDCDDQQCYAVHIAPLLDLAAVTEADRIKYCPRYARCVVTNCAPGRKFNFDTAATFVLDCKTEVPADRLREYPQEVGSVNQDGATDPSGDDSVLTSDPVTSADPPEPTEPPLIEIIATKTMAGGIKTIGVSMPAQTTVGGAVVVTAYTKAGMPVQTAPSNNTAVIIAVSIVSGVIVLSLLVGFLVYHGRKEKDVQEAKKKAAAKTAALSEDSRPTPPPRYTTAAGQQMTQSGRLPLSEPSFTERSRTPSLPPPTFDRDYPWLPQQTLDPLYRGQAVEYLDLPPSNSRYAATKKQQKAQTPKQTRSKSQPRAKEQSMRITSYPPEYLQAPYQDPYRRDPRYQGGYGPGSPMSSNERAYWEELERRRYRY